MAFADLQPNAGFVWTFTDPSQVHVWMIPSFADGQARSWQISIVPVQSSLDVAGRRLDPAILPTAMECNAAGAGGSETCIVSVGATEASERFWLAVWPQAGLGDYQIMLTLQ